MSFILIRTHARFEDSLNITPTYEKFIHLMKQINWFCTLKHALNLICSPKELLNDFQTSAKHKLLLEILIENKDPSGKILKNYSYMVTSDWQFQNVIYKTDDNMSSYCFR